jgi:Fe-S-cluster containining protein
MRFGARQKPDSVHIFSLRDDHPAAKQRRAAARYAIYALGIDHVLCVQAIPPERRERDLAGLSDILYNNPLAGQDEALEMTAHGDNGPLDFFKALQGAFAKTIQARRSHPTFVTEISAQAFDSFDGNVAIQSEGLGALSCQEGCAACCMLRVVATAPEILLIARYIVATKEAFAGIGVDLARNTADGCAVTDGLDEKQRMALRRHCSFIRDGLCLIYRVRPLACRGHASYDRFACIEAVAGRESNAQLSVPHLLVRSLVQNALLSALRDCGLAWGLYELDKAVNLALSNTGVEKAWVRGDDPFVSATVAEFDAQSMEATFDAL